MEPVRPKVFPMFQQHEEREPILSGPSPVEPVVKSVPIKEPKKNLHVKEDDDEEAPVKKDDDDSTQSMAQAEVEAMLDVEKRQENAVMKSQKANNVPVTVNSES